MEKYILHTPTNERLVPGCKLYGVRPLETGKYYIFYCKYVNYKSCENNTNNRPIEKGFNLYYSTRMGDSSNRRVLFRNNNSLLSISGHTYNDNSYLLVDCCFEYGNDKTLINRKLSLIDNVFYCNDVAVNVNDIIVGTAGLYKDTGFRDIEFELNPFAVYLDEYLDMLTKNNPGTIELLENVLSKYKTPNSSLEDKIRKGCSVKLPISELRIKCLDENVIHVYPAFFIRYLHRESLLYDKNCEGEEIVTLSKELFWCERLPSVIVSLFFYNLSSSRVPTSKEIIECGNDVECTLRTFCNLSKFFTIEGYDTLYENIYKDMYG